MQRGAVPSGRSLSTPAQHTTTRARRCRFRSSRTRRRHTRADRRTVAPAGCRSRSSAAAGSRDTRCSSGRPRTSLGYWACNRQDSCRPASAQRRRCSPHHGLHLHPTEGCSSRQRRWSPRTPRPRTRSRSTNRRRGAIETTLSATFASVAASGQCSACEQTLACGSGKEVGSRAGAVANARIVVTTSAMRRQARCQDVGRYVRGAWRGR